MKTEGATAPKGQVGLTVIRGDGRIEHPSAAGNPNRLFVRDSPISGIPTMKEIHQHAMPQKGLPQVVNDWRKANQEHFWRYASKVKAMEWCARVLGHGIAPVGTLYGTVIRGDGSVEPLGLMSMAVVTTVGVGFIVDAFQNLVELELMKFHGYGTGGTAENVADTALVTELTTQYATDNTRPTGTTVEGASGNIYRTVATLSPDANVAITEHGVFSATSAGTLLDRSLFTVVNLVGSADSLQTTYEITFTAGS
jgi:hypothetical protein